MDEIKVDDEIIEFETKVESNFLTKGHNTYALPLSLFILFISLALSNIYWHGGFGLAGYLQATPELVFEKGQYWRLFTSSLIHGDLAHFLSNSIMLTLMSYFVIAHYGFTIYPILSLIMGAVINYMVLLTFKHNASSIVGASGIVYYLWGFWLVLYLFIQRHVPLTRRFMKIAAISLVILVPSTYRANVSYLAHGIGFVLGLITGFIYFTIHRKFLFSWEKKVQIANVIPDIDYNS